MQRPNILFLMTDQMQARVLDADHPCRTPNFDRLARRGVRFTRAYTTNAICSPARASLMTGLLPHNHGVLSVTHCFDRDQMRLRTDQPHFAQRLADAGYRTGYFGKWHVEHDGDPTAFGWQQASSRRPAAAAVSHGQVCAEHYFDNPPGYKRSLFYRGADQPADNPDNPTLAENVANDAQGFLREVLDGDTPWCCFASCIEPHDPFICRTDTYQQYDVDRLPLSASADDPCNDKPNLYRRGQRPFSDLTDRQRREAMACYYASITEVDAAFGRLIDQVEAAGELDNTIIVLTSDHGEHLGAHGLWMKNIGAFEEVYNIPLLVAGPGVARNSLSAGRVGLHDLCPTLCALADAQPIDHPDSRSIVPLLQSPEKDADFQQGFAEYFGTRHMLTQRIVYDGPWKFVHNGFDFDELYHLDDDPNELANLADAPDYREQVKQMMQLAWDFMNRTNDHTLVNTSYPILRIADVGPATSAPA